MSTYQLTRNTELNPMAEIIRVAVGVVINTSGEILIARRRNGQHLAGKWEFPGGKIEASETCPQALTRELAEEVAIQVDASEPLLVIQHAYPEKTVELDVRLVREYIGVAVGREGQSLAWVPLKDLDQYDFPEANKPIIAKLNEIYSG